MSQAGNKLRDIFIAHSFDLEKVKASSARAISRTMDDLILELVRELYQIDPLGVTRTAYQQERLEKLLSMAQQTVRSQFKLIAGDMKKELITLAEIESLFATKAINSVFTVEMADYVTSREVLTRLVDNTLIEGAPSAEWWGKQSQDLQDSFSRAMRTGVARGETLPQMAARLRGTQKPGVLGVTGNIPGVTNEQILGVTYDPGLIKKAKRNAEALVRTSYQAVTSAARNDVYRANSDVVKGYQFLATLDNRTCWSPESLIVMADGSTKPIKDVKVGEYVMSGLSGKPVKVLAKESSVVDFCLELCYDDRKLGRTTHGHKIFTEFGWEEVGNLRLCSGVSEWEAICRRYDKR